jgi:hypothetical protein
VWAGWLDEAEFPQGTPEEDEIFTQETNLFGWIFF